MRVNQKEISVHFIKDGLSWNFEALWRGQHVGYAWCSLQSGNLIINDFKVDDTHSAPQSFLKKFLVLLSFLPRKMNFRGLGVGTRLMDQIITEAVKSRVENIWGYITQHDINSTPYLLDWYQRRGFSITEPDGYCIKNAVKKIVMKLDVARRIPC